MTNDRKSPCDGEGGGGCELTEGGCDAHLQTISCRPLEASPHPNNPLCTVTEAERDAHSDPQRHIERREELHDLDRSEGRREEGRQGAIVERVHDDPDQEA